MSRIPTIVGRMNSRYLCLSKTRFTREFRDGTNDFCLKQRNFVKDCGFSTLYLCDRGLLSPVGFVRRN